jgi:hypothetical protein
VRVGIDASYGHWNAPADPSTREFVYVPIPEACEVRLGLGTRYSAILPALRSFAASRRLDLESDLGFPAALRGATTHLDPDFGFLTYGDDGGRRGSYIAQLRHGDLVVFYAGMRSVVDRSLIYGLVGMLTIDEVVSVGVVPSRRWGENAHTRRLQPSPTEIVVRGVPGRSGRLARYIAIGEWRAGAYRVRRELLDAWGGLSVKDGFIQRSARPPRFLDARRFQEWLDQQGVALMRQNN